MHQSEKLMTGSELDEKDKYVRVDHGKRITPPPEKQNSWRWSAADMILHQLLIIRSSPTKLPGTWRRRRERNNSYSRACTDWADLSCGINRPRWRRARAVSERPSERVLLELNGTRWNEPALKRALIFEVLRNVAWCNCGQVVCPLRPAAAAWLYLFLNACKGDR
jgi:hypothetical protein